MMMICYLCWVGYLASSSAFNRYVFSGVLDQNGEIKKKLYVKLSKTTGPMYVYGGRLKVYYLGIKINYG